MKTVKLLFAVGVSIYLLSGCATSSLKSIPLPLPDIPTLGKKVKREYFTNGQLRSEFIMDDESGKNGILKVYGYDGKITSIAKIQNGVKHGIETWFDKQGRLLMRVPYVNGRKHGVQEAYYENGDLWLTYTYVKGQKHGPAVMYDKNGRVIKKVVFEHGRVVR